MSSHSIPLPDIPLPNLALPNIPLPNLALPDIPLPIGLVPDFEIRIWLRLLAALGIPFGHHCD